MIESNHLTLLSELIVSVHILQRIHPIRALLDTLDDEMSTTVRPAYTQHRQLLKGRIGLICIESHENSFHWLEVLGCNHIARHLHCVDLCTRREAVSVVSERVSLVIITDCITEINRVSSVSFERIEQLNFNRFACSLDFGSFQLRWRNNHILTRIVYLDELIKTDFHLPDFHIDVFIGRRCPDNSWRSLIIPAPIRVSHACTRGETSPYPSQGGEYKAQENAYLFLYLSLI